MSYKKGDMRRAVPFWLRRRMSLSSARNGGGERRIIARFYRLYYWQR